MPKKKKTSSKKRPSLTGKSNTAVDKQMRAKPPGRRKAASGNVYFERRRNRADADKRKRL